MSEAFRCILADPPWNFKTYSNKGWGKSAQSAYPCMAYADIVGMGELVRRVAAPDSVLFLWVTNPFLPQAFPVITAWGYEYVTKVDWIKARKDDHADVGVRIQIGTGYNVREASETMLICKRKSRAIRVGAPAPGRRLPSGIIAPRGGKFGKKPEAQYDHAEVYDGPYLELFARRTRPGWTSVGNEIDGLDVREALRLLADGMAGKVGVR